MTTVFRHVMKPIFLGLCPVCWFCILAIVILTVLFFHLLRSRDAKKRDEMKRTKERTAYDQKKL